jgi:hypothetical protein
MSPEEETAGHQSERAEEPEVVYSGGGTGGRIRYRAMREDPAGGPITGPTARTLGVRVGIDIPVVGGKVLPNSGGMSVAPDRPENLHPLRRPPAYGGRGKDPIWWIRADQVGGPLQYRPDSPTHGLIEPAFAMTPDELRKSIEDTNPLWTKCP